MASRITALCRSLTVERGLNGFTIEDVCSEVGISRRTFFNYFPSKEEAVFGIVEEDELKRFAEEFLARGSRGWPAVVDDLVDIIGHLAESAGLSAADHVEFMAVLEREPRLLARFVGMNRAHEAGLIELVALRESVSTRDERSRASIALMGTVLRSVGDRLTEPDVAEDFTAALTTSLAAMREVLTPIRKAHS